MNFKKRDTQLRDTGKVTACVYQRRNYIYREKKENLKYGFVNVIAIYLSSSFG